MHRDPTQVLHVANHVLSMLTQTGERGLPAALQANDPSAFEGGEGALLRCVEELVTCIRISERDTLARLICRYKSYVRSRRHHRLLSEPQPGA